MCLLTFFQEGVMPDTNALEHGALFNSDGHGFAIIINGRIHIRKDLNADRLISEFDTLRSRHPEGPAFFHSRFTTDGIDGKYNIHPFEVRGLKSTVMAHNGIFPDKARPKTGDIRSDTRIVAEEIIPKSGFPLWTRRGRRSFGRWMGTGNKVAILTLDKRFLRSWYIINEQEGHWDDGIWYSNGGYQPRITVPANWEYTAGGWKSGSYDDYRSWWEEQDRTGIDCVLCQSKGTVSVVTNFCDLCDSCQDCTMTLEDCFCYTPVALDHRLIGEKAIAASLERARERDEVRARLAIEGK